MLRQSVQGNASSHTHLSWKRSRALPKLHHFPVLAQPPLMAQVIAPIRSRCVCIRIAAPSHEEVMFTSHISVRLPTCVSSPLHAYVSAPFLQGTVPILSPTPVSAQCRLPPPNPFSTGSVVVCSVLFSLGVAILTFLFTRLYVR